jgi:hypothetical protein
MILVGGEDEMGDRLVDQCAARRPQQGRRGEVGFEDHPGLAEGEVAHRRQVVQVEVARPRRLQLELRPAQFFVLHLQLDLMHVQLLHQPVDLVGRQRSQIVMRHGCSPGFGLLAQGCCGHGTPPVRYSGSARS